MARRIFVTGADGFVGSWMIRRLLDDGHDVYGAVRPAPDARPPMLTTEEAQAVRWLPLELGDDDSVRRVADLPYDAVVHLAAVASGAQAKREPATAWLVNAVGTARLAQALADARAAGRADPVFLVVSTAEVYGRGNAVARRETDPVAPCSPYGASKAAAEIAALEAWRRTGVRVVIARAFPHTGPGQDPRFVMPALIERLRFAKRIGAPVVKVGNLEPVREFLHVRDVVDAYARLLSRGEPGEVYNVARGEGVPLEEVFRLLCDRIGYHPIPELDPDLVRPADIPHLVGDASKLSGLTGWRPRVSFTDLVAEMVHAQAD